MGNSIIYGNYCQWENSKELEIGYQASGHIFDFSLNFISYEYLFILSMQGCALWIPSVLQYIQCAQTWRT